MLRSWDLVWVGLLVAFLAFELPAAFGWVPWQTLSSTSWGLESWWSPFTLLFEVFLAVLLLHICFRLSSAALIFVTIAAVIAVGIHLAEKL